jgi:hypothetical protein
MSTRHARRWTRLTTLAACLTVATSVATPSRADAAQWCSWDAQPAGVRQYGSCQGGILPHVIGGFLGSLMEYAQVPVVVQGVAQQIVEEGYEMMISDLYDRHTKFGALGPWSNAGAPFCSFNFPGENRFVGDKFAWDGWVDWLLPWPIFPAIVHINRYVGPVENTDLAGTLTDGGNLVDSDALVAKGVIAPMATVRVGLSYGVLPIHDRTRVRVNGHSYTASMLTGRLHPQVIEVEVPISVLRFPGMAPNGYCPWPAANFVLVTEPALNSSVDWVEIEIKTTPPVVLVPGDQTLSFQSSLATIPCRQYKYYKSLASNANAIAGGVAEVVGGRVPNDACSMSAASNFGSMLSEIGKDGYATRTTDDMVQVPSFYNSDPVGWMMCDASAGGSWTPNAPLNYYLTAAAKSMGVGTIDVIAHSKGGVDLLHYMKGPWYQEANEDHTLYIRNVATLSSGFKGIPLAAGFRIGRGSPPLPNGHPNRLGAATDWFTFLNYAMSWYLTEFYNVDNYDPYRETPGDVVNIKFLSYILDLMSNAACALATGVGREGVRLEQNPDIEYRLTKDMLNRPWGGPRPTWVTFGANADSTGDDRVDTSCTGFISGVLDLIMNRLLGDTRIERCTPGDQVQTGIMGQVFSWSYAAIGSYYCKNWTPWGTCTTWEDFKHNDAVVDEYSASLGRGFPHYVLDEHDSGEHESHSYGISMGGSADHFTIYQEHAGDIWTKVKSVWGYPKSPTAEYP